MREKLFLSYSTGDEWRDLFLKHMRTMLSEKQLFVDKQSLRDGAEWKAQLEQELACSKCALLLLTPQYLEVGNFAQDEELPMLLEEHQKPDGLKLLPVLVENCAYTEHPELASLQLVGWDNNTKSVKRGTDMREVIRALKEAGDEAITPRAGESAIDQAVKEVCERARKEFGVIGQITQQQQDDLFQCLNRHRKRGCIHHGLSETGQAIECWPRFWYPQVRTDNALRAVKEHFVDLDRQYEVRCLAASRHRLPQNGVPNDSCAPADAQRFALSRNEEDETDPWILQDVRECIRPAISRPVRDRQGLVIQHSNEARSISLRGNIHLSTRVPRRNQHEGRPADEGAAVPVQGCDGLRDTCRRRLPHDFAELRGIGDDVVELHRDL